MQKEYVLSNLKRILLKLTAQGSTSNLKLSSKDKYNRKYISPQIKIAFYLKLTLYGKWKLINSSKITNCPNVNYEILS